MTLTAETWWEAHHGYNVRVTKVLVYKHTEKCVWTKWSDTNPACEARRSNKHSSYSSYYPTREEAYADAHGRLERQLASAIRNVEQVKEQMRDLVKAENDG